MQVIRINDLKKSYRLQTTFKLQIQTLPLGDPRLFSCTSRGLQGFQLAPQYSASQDTP